MWLGEPAGAWRSWPTVGDVWAVGTDGVEHLKDGFQFVDEIQSSFVVELSTPEPDETVGLESTACLGSKGFVGDDLSVPALASKHDADLAIVLSEKDVGVEDTPACVEQDQGEPPSDRGLATS